MILLPEVRDGWADFTVRFEGRIPWLYQDVRGLVTTGLGCLVDPISLALPLPWQWGDGPATEDVVETDWKRVKRMPPALPAKRYKAVHGVWLTEDAIDAIALTKLDANAVHIVRYFPDLESYPAPVQQALMSMSWAMGPDFPSKWPRFSASVRNQDWKVAAAQCHISTANNAGVVARNVANAALFESAVTEG